ncbi:hypothetical protein KAW80_02180 [Candidatus Babeliales bacterium]|nr:hypothetical protein [Candidatus Babeliales bacterium]
MKFNFKTNPLIEIHLEEFAALNQKENSDWFSELRFCILTANSQAKKANSKL